MQCGGGLQSKKKLKHINQYEELEMSLYLSCY